jgi:adenylylsulfate kinase
VVQEKTSIGRLTLLSLLDVGYKVELMDADEYRKDLCRDLGYSREDRLEISAGWADGMKLAGQKLSRSWRLLIIRTRGRAELRSRSGLVRTVFIDCPISVTRARDTKGHRKAALPIGDAEHIGQFTGVMILMSSTFFRI